MAFLDRLREQAILAPSANPVAPMGAVGGDDIAGILSSIEPFINRMKNRNLEDLRTQASIINPNLPIRPNRIGNIFDPNAMQGQEQSAPQNVVFQPSMTDFQRANLGLEERKLAQSGRLGEERLGLDRARVGIQSEAQQLNELKNQQIYETKIKDMERKAEEAESKMAFAERQLQSNENNRMMQDQFRRAQLDALNARNELALAQKESEFAATNKIAQERLEAYKKAIEDAGYLLTEETISEDEDTGAQKRTRIVKKGQPPAEDKKKDPLGLRK
jgi:hypothetical protein